LSFRGKKKKKKKVAHTWKQETLLDLLASFQNYMAEKY
jgi:hypothetical protein